MAALEDAVQGRWGHGVRMCLLAQRVCACGRVCRGARCRAFVSLTTGRFASLAIERSLHSLQNASL